MEEKKGFFTKLREYWKIPRYRSIIILGLYILGFASVFLYSSIANSNVTNYEEESVDPLTNLSIMDNYEYSYEVVAMTSNGLSGYEINGIRYDNTDNFSILGNDFYIKDEVIYSKVADVDINKTVHFDLMMLRPDDIYEYLKASTLINKIEYETGEIKSIYELPVKLFNIIHLGNIPDNNDVIKIITYENGDYINKIDIDILNIMKFLNIDLKSYEFNITYSNINNIKKVEN